MPVESRKDMNRVLEKVGGFADVNGEDGINADAFTSKEAEHLFRTFTKMVFPGPGNRDLDWREKVSTKFKRS